MVENVERAGGQAVILDFEWGKPVDPNVVEAAFKEHNDLKILAFVHAETSTGVRSDAQTLAKIAHKNGALTIVDTVTSLSGIPVLVDEWELDAVYSASQKCLSCTPGLSPVTLNQRAIDKVKARKDKVHSWFMDMNLLTGYWSEGTRTYHHTAPTNSLFALHEALVLIQEEGLENTWARHLRFHNELKQGLYALGLDMFVAEEYQLPQMNAVVVPDGLNDPAIRKQLLNDYNLEIGAGLGPLAGKIWRIGIMGYSARAENIMLCLTALRKVI
jgi:alanine-glyoxylate transaminase/serine-glyoxylate transaminase/serine-pyruvate transaminase